MGNLTSGLNIALQSLLADQGAIDTTSNNIANVNTPGYSRQTAVIEETPPIQIGHLTFGTGAQLAKVLSQRDSILDLRVNQETQQQGKLESFLGPAQQIQTLFNETNGTGLQTDLTAFFNSFSQLSTNPSDLNLRQAVLSATQNLAGAFNQSSTALTTLQRNTDQSVSQTVSQINTLTTQIAAVNAQVTAALGTGQNAGPFADQRQQLINQLSRKFTGCAGWQSGHSGKHPAGRRIRLKCRGGRKLVCAASCRQRWRSGYFTTGNHRSQQSCRQR